MKAIPALWTKISDSDFDKVPTLLSPRYLPSLDGLRAASIAIVIACHILHGTYYIRYINGSAGVDIFFVISGFLITTLLLKEKVASGRISLKGFYARRFLRIFPVAYLYLAVLIFLNAPFHLHITDASFANAFFYVKNFSFFKASEWQTGHFWSLAIEEQFYLVFPFILTYNYKLYIRLIIPIILLAPCLNLLSYHGPRFLSSASAHFVLQCLVDAFGDGTAAIFCGSLLSILLFKEMIPLASLKKFSGLGLFLLSLLLFLNTPEILRFPGKEMLNLYLFAPGICVVILLCIQQPGRSFTFAFFNNKVMRTIGVLSYSLYIWQQLFTYQRPWAKSFRYGDALWLNLLALGAVTCISYYCFEKQFLRLKNRLKTTGPSLIIPSPEQPEALPAAL